MSNTNTAELKTALESETTFYDYAIHFHIEELRQQFLSLLAEQNQGPDRAKVQIACSLLSNSEMISGVSDSELDWLVKTTERVNEVFIKSLKTPTI